MNEQSTLTIGQVAWLKVVDVNHLGAFVDWGLSKDLFVPFAEQQHPLKPDAFTLVKVYIDNQGRPAGSTRIDHWIEDTATGLEVGEQVELLVAEQTCFLASTLSFVLIFVSGIFFNKEIPKAK